MAFYEYECGCCGRFDRMRSVNERNDPISCSKGQPAQRVLSVPTITWAPGTHPVRGTSWYDIHDKSPRELARDPNVERYDPSGPVDPVKADNRPAIERAFKEAVQVHGGIAG
jgi:putative FmdB family regulatory protein